MNKLLERQIRKLLGGPDAVPKELMPLLNAVGEAYDGAESDRKLMERAFDLSSQEMAKIAVQLREANQFSREVIDQAGVGIIVYDCELRYVFWNPFMETLAGISAATVLGRKAREVFPHLSERGIDRLLDRALTGETVTSPDTPFHVPATGKSGWVVGTCAPHRNGTGDIVGVIATVRDITKRKHAEEALRTHMTQVEMLNQVMLTREKRIVEVKQEVNALLRELGRSLKYGV